MGGAKHVHRTARPPRSLATLGMTGRVTGLSSDHGSGGDEGPSLRGIGMTRVMAPATRLAQNGRDETPR
jgi:hypothetical protein